MHSYWGQLIVEELVRNNINYFCISPGSRSTPLTVAAGRHPLAQTIVCYDERGAAFHALGYARATGLPAVLLCTSGTAAANYLPAVIEADIDGLPMLILSADRPPELRHTMANQTIRQVGMFAHYVRWQVDLPVPTVDIKPEFVLTTIDQAIHQTMCSPMGPVHLNCMFRKPLEPIESTLPENYTKNLAQWEASDTPFTQYPQQLTIADHTPLESIISQAQKGILVVGRLRTTKEKTAVLAFADKLGWPVFAGVSSGLRLGTDHHPTIIHYFDRLLLSNDDVVIPDVVIHIGGQLVSKQWIDYCTRIRPAIYAVIEPSPNRYDPFHGVTHHFDTDISYMLSTVIHSYPQLFASYPQVIHNSGWLNQWYDRSKAIRKIIEGNTFEPLDEIGIATVISATIPPTHALFIGNSMPSRDMDMYAVNDGARPSIVALNRGASGIDGNLSTGMGVAVGSNQPTTILVGDLTFIHDMNALTLLCQLTQPVTIVVINNSGGGIFHHLPIAAYQDVFESYFGTPHTLTFKSIADAFNITYAYADTIDQLKTCYTEAINENKHQLLEVRTERESNTAAHRAMVNKIKKM